MAERRMFSKIITNSAKFLMMPATARLLYYDLGMAADDDGAVEAFAVLRLTGASLDDLNTLADRGYIKILNGELVSYICDWTKNNLIKRDRYHPSVYKEMLPLSDIDEKSQQSTPTNAKNSSTGTQTEPSRNQTGTQTEPEVRLGKDRLDKDSIGKFRGGEARRDAEPKPSVTAEAASPPPTPEKDIFCLVSEGVNRKYIEERLNRAIDYAKAHKRSAISVLRDWWANDKSTYSEPHEASFDTEDFFSAALERSELVLKRISPE